MPFSPWQADVGILVEPSADFASEAPLKGRGFRAVEHRISEIAATKIKRGDFLDTRGVTRPADHVERL